VARAAPFAHRNFRFVADAEQSRRLARLRSGAVIIAASGMCEAGRIRHHLRNHLWRAKATVLLVGYQAPGTLGRLLQEGVQAVRIEGEEIEVKAAIRQLDVYSAHADRKELVDWALGRMPVHRTLLLTHGEPGALAGLADRLAATGRVTAPILRPALDDVLALGPGEPALCAAPRPRLPAEAVGQRTDWHNDYASFLLALNARLRGPNNAAAKRRLLRDLAERLAGD
jgi:metallo-beta-lactamase family protein